jgi:hypothetical protein
MGEEATRQGTQGRRTAPRVAGVAGAVLAKQRAKAK